MSEAIKAYRAGTHRSVSPETTLARILPLLASYGITRLADITGLDCLGIPTYCAIRPAAVTLQVSNGKGPRPVDAQVSALMEGLEFACAEGPPNQKLLLASTAEMELRGEPFSLELPAHATFARPPVGRIEWARGAILTTGAPVWLPAATVWHRPRQWIMKDWNGLASGNTLLEATLHALYEVLERHVLSSLVVDGMLDFSSTQMIELDGCEDEVVGDLVSRIHAARVKVILLRGSTSMSLHTFMAVLLDPSPFGGASAVNVGYGAHLSPSVAASRAITEAAQSRLTFIHGAREDLRKDTYEYGIVHARLFDFFDSLEPDSEWSAQEDFSTDSLSLDHARLLSAMTASGLGGAVIDLSPEGAPFFVAKVTVPGALCTIPC